MKRFFAAFSVIVLGFASACDVARAATKIPDPVMDEQLTTESGERMAVLAGGCFWGVQAVFQHLKGVKRVWAGYAGGAASTADYEAVHTGRTGHAESVQVFYDPAQITFGQILKVFFSVAHDPTELNRQGPDEGTQYRSAIFFANDEQREIANGYIGQLHEARVYKHRIVTEVSALKGFYKAEEYHQNYVTRHPNDPYVVFNDLPKLSALRKQFPDRFVP